MIVVDDGLDGGLPAAVGVRAIRRHDPESVVVAVPVASSSAVRRLAGEADHVLAPVMPRFVGGCARRYRNFSPVSDTQVADLLRACAAPSSS